jgi:hypothetical protein
LKISHLPIIFWSFLAIAAEFYIIQTGISRLFSFLLRFPSSSSTAVLDRALLGLKSLTFSLFGYYFPYCLQRFGINNLCIIYGFFWTIMTGIILHWFIPALTPAHIAWPIFILAHSLLVYGQLKFIGMAYFCANSSNAGKWNAKREFYGDSSNRNDATSGREENEIESLDIGQMESLSLLSKSNAGNEENHVNSTDSPPINPSSSPNTPSLMSLSPPTLITRSTSSNVLAAAAADKEKDKLGAFNESKELKGNPNPPISSSIDSRLHLSLTDLSYVLLWEFLVFSLMRLRIYPEFVVKMFVIFPLLLGVMVAAINLTRLVFFQVAKHANLSDESKDKL